MPPSEHPRVFISYAHKDGATLAQRLHTDLKTHGFDAWLDTQRIEGGATWTTKIEDALDDAQYVLALLTPGSYVSEICRAEQLRSLRKGKCVIPIKAQPNTDIPLHLEAKNYCDFSNPAQYEMSFAVLLSDIHGNVSAALPQRYRSTPLRYLTAPPRVANYLERPEALNGLRDTLFAEDHRQPIALTAVHGMGGIGKTVLAKALTDDEVVRAAFPDGIVWITAGKERKRDFVAEMREVAKALGDDLSGYDNDLACENQYRTTMANKAALIVVDDVWSKTDIEPLLAESPRSRFLFTTRDAAIGNLVGARDHRADLLDDAQSRELLALWANKPFPELPAVADDIIRECGRLPLALSVLGGMLRGKNAQYWADTLARLRKADISSIRKQLPTGQETFFKAVETSFQSLEPEMQEQYKTLAVLLEDMPAPLPILATLWNVDTSDARLISNRFVELSLAQLEGATESIRLHDLQLDYVRAQFPDKKALNLIHSALRLSSHVITNDPGQFASQMLGRLLPYVGPEGSMPALQQFTGSMVGASPRPWLRPLRPTLSPPGTALICTLAGHSERVNGVAVSADGRLAVSASYDGTLKLWDLESGRELRTLPVHSAVVSGVVPVRRVAMSADGQLAVSNSDDATVKLWDLESGRELPLMIGHSRTTLDVAMSADGRRVLFACTDGTLKVWDLETGREVRTLEGHSGLVHSVAVSADGRRAVSISEEKILKVWDLESGRELRTLEGHSDRVWSVAVSGDGERAVSASSDKTLKMWDLESGRELHTLEGHSELVKGAAVSLDGKRAISASWDNTVRVWDLETGHTLRTLRGHSGWVNGVAVSADGRRAVSASEDKTLKVWDLERDCEVPTLEGHSGWVNGIAVSTDGRRAVSASYDNTLKVWDLDSGRELRTLRGHADRVNSVAVSGDGERAVSASWDRTLRVWDLESGHELHILEGHLDRVMGVALSADGRLAVSASWDSRLKLWDLESGRELRTLEGHSSAVLGVAVDTNSWRAVSASYDGRLKVWDLESGRELQTVEGHRGPIMGVAVSADGRRAVSASWDKTLKVWDLESDRELLTLEGHSDEVFGVAVSVDVPRVVSASRDRTVKVWDLGTGALVATFTCDATARCCAISGARRIVAGDELGHVHFLSLEERKLKG